MTHLDPSRSRTLTELLRARAELHPDQIALRFFESGERETNNLTFGRLDSAARATAAMLRERSSPGQRVLLMYPPGLDFIASFCACLYAGVIAVPAYPPEMHRLEHAIRRLQAVIDDAKPAVVLTTKDILGMAAPLASAIAGADKLFAIPWMAADEDASAAARWTMPDIGPSTLAFLQYTSGSTGNPKGAMLSHGNLLADLEMLQMCFGNRARRALDGVCWVPLYHDLGLIGHVLTTLYTGGACSVLSPIDFLKKPLRWLRLLSETKAYLTGGPNFGFDLCVRKITPEEVSTLDLRHVQAFANCAEPVRARTLERFFERFAPAGLSRKAFMPCYGLAEATVLVTSTSPDRPPTILHVDKRALEEHRLSVTEPGAEGSTALVGCGKPWNDGEVVIASTSGSELAKPGTVGEIWTRGPNVAAGYWGRPEATQETFGARLDGDAGKPYLRTGDLGFMHEGELYVTGRLKDLVIVRGRNLYPQDVERAVDELRANVPEIRIGCSAAIPCTVDDHEELVFLQEVSGEASDGFDPNLCASEIRRVIFESFEVQPYEVVLIKSGTIPKTSSGKIMRSTCREAYAHGFTSGIIETLYRERGGKPAPPSSRVPAAVESAPVSIMAPASTWEHAAAAEAASHVVEPSRQSRELADEMLTWLRAWAPERFDPDLADGRRSIAPHVVLDLGKAGILGMRVPSRWGGQGLSMLDSARVMQQLAALDIGLASIVGVNNALGIQPIVGFARADLRDALLPDLATGRKLATFALTERCAGANPLALEARAVGDASGRWALYGEKIWVALGSWASIVNVFVKQEGEGEGVSGFALTQPRQGMRVGPEALSLGVRSMVQSSLVLDGARADESELLGATGDGFGVAVHAMSGARLMNAAIAIGGMKRALQLMARYADRRSTGAGSLIENPVSREWVAQATFAVLALDALVARLASLRDGGANVPAEAFAAAKLAASELLWTTSDHLVQLLGGRGYMEPNGASRLLRDARLLRLFESSSETLAAHLGGSVVRSADRWKTLLSSSLRAPRTAVKLARAADELKAAMGERADLGARRFVQHRAGMLLCWTLLSAALEGGGGRGALWAQAGAWLSERFDEALLDAKAASSRAKDLPGTNELREMLSRFVAQIGDLELAGHGEALETDALLRKAPVSQEATLGAAHRSADARSAGGAQDFLLFDAAATLGVEGPLSEAPSTSRSPSLGMQRLGEDAARQREVEDWLKDWVSRNLRTGPESIDVDVPLTAYGVDSIAVVEATSDIEQHFSLEVPESVFWNYRTIRALSKYIADRLDRRGELHRSTEQRPSTTRTGDS